MSDQHSSLINTPKQLVVVVALAFVVPITLIVLVAQLATTVGNSGQGANQEAVLARIKPIGELTVADASAPHVLQSGQQVFEGVCTTCHGAGLAGAPKAGDKAAWAPLIKQGYDVLVQHALHGNQRNGATMPPKGGNPALDDVEVARAVAYMANLGGASFAEPTSGPAPAQTTAPAPAQTTAAAPASTTASTQVAGAASGKATFESTCVVCHGTGAAGAPKAGDKAAWAPRIKTGMDALYHSALNGKNAMPPRGGNASLSDSEVKAAVNYLVSLAK